MQVSGGACDSAFLTTSSEVCGAAATLVVCRLHLEQQGSLWVFFRGLGNRQGSVLIVLLSISGRLDRFIVLFSHQLTFVQYRNKHLVGSFVLAKRVACIIVILVSHS